MASTKPEFSLLGLPAEQIQGLVEMQFNAQQQEYQNAYPGSEQSIVMLAERRAGRIWVARGQDEIHVVDISLLPEFRRAGIGTALYRQLMGEAQATAKPVRCSVFHVNEASLRFHQRLGFKVVAETALTLDLQWVPPAS